MNVHESARTSPYSRTPIARRVIEEGQAPGAVALDFGVSRRTVYKWLSRFRAAGRVGRASRRRQARTERQPTRASLAVRSKPVSGRSPTVISFHKKPCPRNYIK